MDDDRLLRWATAVYVVGFAVHTADHARRGIDAVGDGVVWAGTFSSMLAAVAVALVVVRHPSAPLLALAIGLPQAIGFFAVHVLPTWGALSDSYPSGDVDGWSWAATSMEIAGALVFAAAGAWALRVRLPASD